ncbi:MAG: sensor histidine kinase, partial [Bacteroidetes bacterium]|nr:sensor histidine kinase [Bacteroidota bacterium]
EIFEETADTGRKAAVYVSMSQLYSGVRDQQKALEYGSKAHELYRNIGDRYGEAVALNLLGTLHLNSDPTVSFDFFEQALALRKLLLDTLGIANCYNNLGICYQHNFMHKKSVEYYQKALALYEKLSGKLYRIVAMNNLGNVYGIMGDNQKRLEYLEKSLILTREISNGRAEVNVLGNLAHYYYSVKKYDEAVKHLMDALDIAVLQKVNELIPDIYNNLAEVAAERGNFSQAYHFHKVFMHLQDSLYHENRNKIFDLQLGYVYERENKEKEMLRLQNQMKDLEVSRQTRLKMFFGILLLLSAVTAIVIYRSYRIKKKAGKILSEQKARLEEMNLILSESENRLKELNLTKDKFFSIMAHDLKNPLGSMVSLADMINHNFSRIPSYDLEDFIKNLHLSVKTVYSLLENLLIWSRSQTGRLDYSPEIFDLKTVVDDCLQLFKFQAEERGISVINSVSRDHTAFADRNMIFTVIRNLVNNGIKFSLPGGKVTISSELGDEKVVVSVTDQGIGMTSADMQKLFRIGVANTTIGTFLNGQWEYSTRKGTGLGLILCKEFVEKCGGKIQVESEHGKGSSFIFDLPVCVNLAG